MITSTIVKINRYDNNRIYNNIDCFFIFPSPLQYYNVSSFLSLFLPLFLSHISLIIKFSLLFSLASQRNETLVAHGLIEKKKKKKRHNQSLLTDFFDNRFSSFKRSSASGECDTMIAQRTIHSKRRE